jgi:Tfp pilus assembly protein PilN
MIRINLLAEERGKKARGGGFALPAAAKQPTEGAPPYPIFIAILVAFVLLTGGYYAWLRFENSRWQTKIQQQQQELKKYEGARKKAQQREKMKAELQAKLDEIKKLHDQQSIPVLLMNRLVEVLPDGAWYTEVSDTGKGIKVVGKARSIKTISTYYDNVTQTAEFASPQMGDIKEAAGDASNLYEFSMTFQYQPKKPAPEKPQGKTVGAGAAASSRRAK